MDRPRHKLDEEATAGTGTTAHSRPEHYRIKFLQDENQELKKLVALYENLFKEEYADLRRRYERKVEECLALSARVTQIEQRLRERK